MIRRAKLLAIDLVENLQAQQNFFFEESVFSRHAFLSDLGLTPCLPVMVWSRLFCFASDLHKGLSRFEWNSQGHRSAFLE
jgi:hypothetical protein